MKLNPVLAELGAHPIAALQDKARSMRLAGERLIDFSIGDPREPTPGFIPQALRDGVPSISQYPVTGGTPELRQAVASYVDRRFGVSVDPNTQVLPTSGSKEAIFTSHLAFVDGKAGDAVAFPSPGYPIYQRGARFAGASAVAVPIAATDFVMKADAVRGDLWHRAAMVWSCSPHNPTGTVASRDDLEQLVERSRATATLFCSDECYADIYEDDPPASALQVSGPDHNGVLAFLSCSKRSGMTGYRMGAVVGDAEAISALKELRSSIGVAPAEFVQAAGVAAWSDDEHAAQRRHVFALKRAALKKAFEPDAVVGSTAGIYLWVRVPDDLAVTDRLLQEGVVVSPGRSFGVGGEGFIRLALVPSVEECESAVEVLQQCLQTVN